MSEMSNDEIRMAIAKAKGWEIVSFEDENDYWIEDDQGEGVTAYERLPDYAEDIAAAWGLWDEMTAAGWTELQRNPSGYNSFSFWPGHRHAMGDGPLPRDVIWFHSDTPQRIISLAYLAWKGV